MVININGKDVGFSYGLYFLGKAMKQKNVDLNELLTGLLKNVLSEAVDLMYYSAVCEAEIDGVEVPITKREFLNYLEKEKDFLNSSGAIAKWSKGLTETISGNFLPENTESEAEGEGLKKK